MGQMFVIVWLVNFVWEGDEEDVVVQKEEDVVFCLESFMFLGFGIYNDVSFLVEEEDEIVKRIIVGDECLKGVSLDVSQGIMLLVKNSEFKLLLISLLVEFLVIVIVIKEQEILLEFFSVIEEELIIYMIDSREMFIEFFGLELWQDFVGRVVEMFMGDIFIVRIEIYFELVEIGEGRELMEIGFLVLVVVVELFDGGGLEKFIDEDKVFVVKMFVVEDWKLLILEQDYVDFQLEKEVIVILGEGIVRMCFVLSKELKEIFKLDVVEEQILGKLVLIFKY